MLQHKTSNVRWLRHLRWLINLQAGAVFCITFVVIVPEAMNLEQIHKTYIFKESLWFLILLIIVNLAFYA